MEGLGKAFREITQNLGDKTLRGGVSFQFIPFNTSTRSLFSPPGGCVRAIYYFIRGQKM